MQIDPSKSIKELVQEFYDKGYYEGMEAGKKQAMLELQPSLTYHGTLSMSYIPDHTNIRLDKRAEICFNFGSNTFRHNMNVYSFQQENGYNKKIAVYTTSPLIRNEIGDYLKFAVEEAIKKDYYNSNSKNIESYMKGIF